MAGTGVRVSEMPFTWPVVGLRGAGALQAKLAFAPDHEKSRAGDDGRTTPRLTLQRRNQLQTDFDDRRKYPGEYQNVRVYFPRAEPPAAGRDLI